MASASPGRSIARSHRARGSPSTKWRSTPSPTRSILVAIRCAAWRPTTRWNSSRKGSTMQRDVWIVMRRVSSDWGGSMVCGAFDGLDEAAAALGAYATDGDTEVRASDKTPDVVWVHGKSSAQQRRPGRKVKYDREPLGKAVRVTIGEPLLEPGWV